MLPQSPLAPGWCCAMKTKTKYSLLLGLLVAPVDTKGVVRHPKTCQLSKPSPHSCKHPQSWLPRAASHRSVPSVPG